MLLLTPPLSRSNAKFELMFVDGKENICSRPFVCKCGCMISLKKMYDIQAGNQNFAKSEILCFMSLAGKSYATTFVCIDEHILFCKRRHETAFLCRFLLVLAFPH